MGKQISSYLTPSFLSFLLIIFFWISGISAIYAKNALLRVVVLNFFDKRDSGNYDYLAESIANDIRVNLVKSFSYQPASSSKNEKVLKSILKAKQKRKKDLHLSDIRDLCKRRNLDIVIYGSFDGYQKTEEQTTTIVIQSSLYIRVFDEFISLGKVANPLDSTIFEVTQKVASLAIQQVSKLFDLSKKAKLTILIAQLSKGLQKNPQLQKRLYEETSFLQESLKNSLTGEITTLSEYLKKSGIEAPAKQNKTSILKWKQKYKIPNIIRIKLQSKGKFVSVFLHEKRKKKDKQVKFTYTIDESKSKEVRQKEVDEAIFEIESEIAETVVLSKENLIRGWSSVALESGLSVNAGLFLLDNVSPFSPTGRAFIRFSPQLLSKKHNIGFLSDFTHPLLKPILFDLAFEFTHAASHVDVFRNLSGQAFINDFSLQFYSLALGMGYTYIFNRVFRISLNATLGYYFASSTNQAGSSDDSFSKVSSNFIFGPTVSGKIALHYLITYYVSLGTGLNYSLFFSNALAESTSGRVSRPGMSIEASYVF